MANKKFENVNIGVKGNKMVITIDLNHRGDLSHSGKTKRVASTIGNHPIEGTEITLGLNAYVKV